jgi:hypothetical protein
MNDTAAGRRVRSLERIVPSLCLNLSMPIHGVRTPPEDRQQRALRAAARCSSGGTHVPGRTSGIASSPSSTCSCATENASAAARAARAVSCRSTRGLPTRTVVDVLTETAAPLTTACQRSHMECAGLPPMTGRQRRRVGRLAATRVAWVFLGHRRRLLDVGFRPRCPRRHCGAETCCRGRGPVVGRRHPSCSERRRYPEAPRQAPCQRIGRIRRRRLRAPLRRRQQPVAKIVPKTQPSARGRPATRRHRRAPSRRAAWARADRAAAVTAGATTLTTGRSEGSRIR